MNPSKTIDHVMINLEVATGIPKSHMELFHQDSELPLSEALPLSELLSTDASSPDDIVDFIYNRGTTDEVYFGSYRAIKQIKRLENVIQLFLVVQSFRVFKDRDTLQTAVIAYVDGVSNKRWRMRVGVFKDGEDNPRKEVRRPTPQQHKNRRCLLERRTLMKTTTTMK